MHYQERPIKAYMEANRLLMLERREIPASVINTLLGAMLWGYPKHAEPFTLGELGERIGLPRTTVSRHLRYLGDFERYGVKGCGWVKVSDYEGDRRQKVVSMTHKGQNLALSLMDTLIGR
ncbi:hypothetical protein FE840_019315 (plasmid) [Peteryoungia desertarenae]|uniref:Uncharacterized protein n=1 Tax=Peteryoungia desertarenae TaxID=1813451 RepID=A0ABX6QTP9_9HYPH|nr:hypothetical protein [Peteryoungia desertarenae]QLF71772.1 hypothetical protein FE840_019315 [Peteryoungia desertarenae]